MCLFVFNVIRFVLSVACVFVAGFLPIMLVVEGNHADPAAETKMYQRSPLLVALEKEIQELKKREESAEKNKKGC